MPQGEAFGEILLGQALLPEDFAGGQFDLAQAGAAIEAGAFVEESVAEQEPLGEGLRVVRKKSG